MRIIKLGSLKLYILALFITFFNVGCGGSGQPLNIDECTVLANDITTDTTLEDKCYNVVGNINVPSDTLLTIKEGTTLFFQEGTQLRVNGALKAIGKQAILEDNGSIRVSAKPVKFTGVQPINGYWDGIYIYDSNDHRNELDNIIIEYAGANGAAFNVDGISRLNIKNSIIKNSGSDGFAIGSNNIIAKFQNITSKDNDGFAGSIYANSLHAIDSSSHFTDNVKGDYIIVKGDTIDKSQTWKALNVPAIITGDVHVDSGKVLTLEAGVTLLFDSSTQLKVQGALKAIGNADKPILFSAKEKIIGYWDGLYFDDASDSKNKLSHVIIEYAGGHNEYDAAIYTTGNSYLDISDSIIQYSKSDGFILSSDTYINQFKRVTVTNNEGEAGILHTNALYAIDSSCDFRGNLGSDYLIVKGGSIDVDQIWKPLSVPIFIMGSLTVEPETVLTLKEGIKLIFDSGVIMRVEGSIISKGTPSKPIILTGLEKRAGYWDGIYLDESKERKNEMTYTTVEYAGGGYRDAAIYLGGESLLKISDSTISNSASYGVYLEYDSALRIDGNTIKRKNEFRNNVKDDVYEQTKRDTISFYN